MMLSPDTTETPQECLDRDKKFKRTTFFVSLNHDLSCIKDFVRNVDFLGIMPLYTAFYPNTLLKS